jgi:hypothetical protein
MSKVQINISLSEDTRDLVRQLAKERGMAQGDVVEQALQAFLEPLTLPEQLSRLAERQAETLGRVDQMREAFEDLVAALKGVAPMPEEAKDPPTEPPPIATYQQMYGSLSTASQGGGDDPPSAPVEAQRHPFRRFLFRRHA